MTVASLCDSAHPESQANSSLTLLEQVDVRELAAIVAPLSRLLSDAKTCIKLTVGKQSIPVGDLNSVDVHDPVRFTIRSTRILRRLCRSLRLIDFATSYMDGDLDWDGDVHRVIEVFALLKDQKLTLVEQCLSLIRGWMSRFSIRNPTFESDEHYSIESTAYELFLDHHMQYTCARFETGDETIDEAQEAKFRLINNLTGPLNGKRHLDVGCGWGGMISYFRHSFGTNSVGITNCAKQAEYIKTRFGLEPVVGDFSVLKGRGDRFDLVTIIGMIEHLSPLRQGQLFKIVYDLLETNGRVYLQCISRPKVSKGGDCFRLIQREVFPGCFIDHPEGIECRLKSYGFSVVEGMRFNHALDYSLTTSRWVARLIERRSSLVEVLGERSYRVFLGYLAMATRRFRTGDGYLMRYVLQKDA